MCAQAEEDTDTTQELMANKIDEPAEEEVRLHSLSNSMNPRIFWIMAQLGPETLDFRGEEAISHKPEEEVGARRKRLRVRPGWLKEFVKLERS